MGRRERRRAETRLRLFRCALQLFAARGFSNVTVEDITDASDVGKGTFFNYFETKDHVLGVMAEIQLGKIREALSHAQDEGATVESVLQHMLQRLAEEPARSPELARALIGSFLASEQVRKLMDRNMTEGRHMLARIFEIGQRRREMDAGLNRQQLALLLQQSFLGALLLWSLHRKPSLQSMVETTFRQFWRSVAKSAREKTRREQKR